MAMQDCLNVIKAAAGEGKISDKQAEQLLSDIDDFITMKKKSLDPENLDATIAQHLQDKYNNSILAAAIEKRNALINARVIAKAFTKADSFKDPANGLSSLLVGGLTSQKGAKLSIDAEGKALANKYLGRLINDLEKSGTLELFAAGKLDDDVARELWQIRPDGNPGITKNTAARQVAEIIHKYQMTAVERLNRAGAYINPRPGYLFRQSHDMTRMREAGFDEWKNFIFDKLDHEATFGTANPEEFLRGAYRGLTTGLHKRFNGEGESNHLVGFTGPANLAKKASQERLLHFKDADSFMAYNEAFGTKNLRDAVIGGLEHMARNTALMEGLGTNPVANFDRILTKLKDKYRDNPAVFDKLSSKSLMNQLKEIDGTTRIPGSVSLARVGSITRAIQNMAKLGGAVISSITDLPMQAAELKYQGVPLFQAYGETILNLFKGRGDAERKEMARMLGVGIDGIIGDIHARFGAQDSLPGRMAKMQQQFFKLNGMAWWDDTNRTGTALIMSNHLAESATKSFDKLDPKLQNVLRQYEIGQLEWDLYRKYGVNKGADGNMYMTSEGLDALTDADVAGYLKAQTGKEPTKRAVQEAKDELISRLDTYFQDRSDHAVPKPGAAERAMLNQGTSSGTIEGEVLRMIMQFKSFPVTMVRRAIGREMYGTVDGKTDFASLVHVMAATTLFGYVSMVAKDVLKGREPRTFTGDPAKDTKLMFAAMSQGGGMGIYGDFLFGEYSRYGRSFLSTLAGPTFGQVDDIAEIVTRIRTGEDIGANVMRMAINNTPFINLFYTRQAMDYLFLYELQEMVNPGYLRRMESRIMRENDQRFFVPPSQQVPYGGSLRRLVQ